MLDNQFKRKTLEESILDSSKRHQKTQSKKAWNDDMFRRSGQQFGQIVQKPEEQRQEGTKKRKGNSTNTRNYFRGNCMMCNRYVSTKCVYLCMISGGDDKTCFSTFHTDFNIFSTLSVNGESSSSSDDE